ncbi:MAG TPA: hypothetical protein DDZ89_11905 [Clostridiales bacterium]|nr:hypothetical protein [Clostridiales bacterium]
MKHIIESANVYLTENCNLNCDYCYEKHTHKQQTMNSAMMDQVIDFCCDHAEEEIRFWLFGGEPLLVGDKVIEFIEKAIRKARQLKIRPMFNVLSNGTMFNKDFAEYWKTHFCVTFQISLDGNKEAHDQHRKTKNGEPTYDRIAENIKEYLKYRRDLHLRLTLMPDTVRSLSTSVASIYDLGVRSLAFMPVHEVEWKQEEIEVYREEFKKVTDLFVGLIQNKEKAYLGNVRLSCPGEYFQAIPCGAGNLFVSITTQGDIYPCHRFIYLDYNGETFKIGDVFRGFDAEKKAMFDDVTIDRMKGCSTCSAKNCSRCLAMNWYMNRDILDSTRKGYCDLPAIHDEAAIKLHSYFSKLYLWAKENEILHEYPFVKKLIEENDYCFHVG